MRILGIESSCDETAVAVVSSPLNVESSVVASQIADHQPYGGVVPELAAREHVQALREVFDQAVQEAEISWNQLDGVAVTQGPGLSSSLLSGLTSGWGLAKRLNVPFYPVHHLEGHILSLYFSAQESEMKDLCPALVLLVTGGHTSLIRMEAPGEYTVLGRSIDDAAGEALDKGARLLGLQYPGGPEIERLAATSTLRPTWFPLGTPDGEKAKERGGEFPFSFSGLKTSLRYRIDKQTGEDPADLAYAYQQSVMNSLVKRVSQALETHPDIRTLACVGGVAKNQVLKAGLQELHASGAPPLVTVPMSYCTDNAAMIAAVPLLRRVEPSSTFPAADPNLPLMGLRLR